MKKWGIAAAAAVCIMVLGIGSYAAPEVEHERLQQGIAEKIIRFHVIADSDSEEDQRVKLAVKEGVVAEIEPMLEGVSSVGEARERLSANLEAIEAKAQDILQQEGSTAKAEAMLTTCQFPVKRYGEFTFPAGEYEALRIVIGKGEGRNWWCVMYPRLCFVDSLYTVVPENSKKELKAQLTDEEYEELLQGGGKVKIKCRLAEVVKELLK